MRSGTTNDSLTHRSTAARAARTGRTLTASVAAPLTVAAALAAVAWTGGALAAPLTGVPVRVVQPGGEVLDLLASGDEYGHRVHDAAGFTVVRDPVTALVVYADLVDGRLVPTGLVVGASNPRDAGLVPGLAAAPNQLLRAAWSGANPGAAAPWPRSGDGPRGAPRTGTIENIVVFIRFKGEPPFGEPFSTYESMFLDPDPARPSLHGYFLEASYGRLVVRSTFYPRPEGGAVLSYEDEHPRSYYQPHDPTTNPGGYEDELEAVMREHALLANALESVAGQVPPGLDVDGDDDGTVDNLVFVVSGSADGWSDLLWPHMSVLTRMVKVNGATALLYNLQLDEVLLAGNAIGVLAHELSHTIGVPDLYHYNHDGMQPLGPWDLMESDQVVPQHMTAYIKRQYCAWIDDIPPIQTDGRYTLAPLAVAPGAALRLPLPESPYEYLVLEYRRAVGTYESSLPGSGLLVFRADSRLELLGNKGGPPDELYVFRPGGSPFTNGDVDAAFLSADVGRTRFAEDSDPYPHLSDGTPARVRVFDVSEALDTISFSVCMAIPDCAGRECGDDGCGGSCGTCPDGSTCDDGLCGGMGSCADWAACRSSCADAACRDACDKAASGTARRLAQAVLGCLANRCPGLGGKPLDACRNARCAPEWAACAAAGDPAKEAKMIADAHRAACLAALCPICTRAAPSAGDIMRCEACTESAGSGEPPCPPPPCVPPWAAGTGTPGCPYPGPGTCECEACTCGMDPYCCAIEWDAACAATCASACGGPSCEGQCEPACPTGACGDDGCGGQCPPCPPDDDPCTVEWCDGWRCQAGPAREGWPCSDANRCTVGDRCVAGSCVPRESKVCRPIDDCHVAGECDPVTGECSNPPLPDGIPCPGYGPEPAPEPAPEPMIEVGPEAAAAAEPVGVPEVDPASPDVSLDGAPEPAPPSAVSSSGCAAVAGSLPARAAAAGGGHAWLLLAIVPLGAWRRRSRR